MTLLEDLAVTVEICGTRLSTRAWAVVVEELKAYDQAAVHGALSRCRRELQGNLTLASILERLDDGRPGPEEAWGSFPKDEGETALVTAEMREAMGAALSMLASGDKVGARMAYLETYKRAVAFARAAHTPVSWTVSLGHDVASRSGILIDAVRAGKITPQYALRIAPEIQPQLEQQSLVPAVKHEGIVVRLPLPELKRIT